MAPDPRVHVGAVAHVQNGRSGFVEHLLVCRGPEASHGANTWALPGGWIEWGETPLKASLRELREECGIDGAAPYDVPLVLANSYDAEELHIVTVCYRFARFFGTVARLEPEKHSAVEWISSPELQEITLFPSTRDYFEAIGLLQ